MSVNLITYDPPIVLKFTLEPSHLLVIALRNVTNPHLIPVLDPLFALLHHAQDPSRQSRRNGVASIAIAIDLLVHPPSVVRALLLRYWNDSVTPGLVRESLQYRGYLVLQAIELSLLGGRVHPQLRPELRAKSAEDESIAYLAPKGRIDQKADLLKEPVVNMMYARILFSLIFRKLIFAVFSVYLLRGHEPASFHGIMALLLRLLLH